MKRILVIEDDMFLVRMYRKILTDAGYEVRILESGVNAFKEAATFKPDLIFLDIIMPEKDGFAVISDLKSEDLTKEIPVVVMSNLGGESDKKKAIDLGADYFRFKGATQFTELVSFTKKILG